MNARVPRRQLLRFDESLFQGKYTLVSPSKATRDPLCPLGEGGSSVVYLAEQTLSAKVVLRRAIKFFVYRDDIASMPQHASSGQVSATHFRDEIENLSAVNHENILKIIEADIWTHPDSKIDIPYLVTEYIDGPTLGEAIQQSTLPELLSGNEHGILDLISQVCNGLRHLHSRGFYHCDIAPKNVFLVGQGSELRAIIGDLGIGRSLTTPQAGTFLCVGSREYCPSQVQQLLNSHITHEQFKELQPAWDVYALAKTAHEALLALPQPEVLPSWRSALGGVLSDTLRNPRRETATTLAERVSWLRPSQRTLADVPELSETSPNNSPMLLAVESVPLSKRMRKLLDHPAIIRLKRIPQLTMASSVFPSANHSRFEHSIGTYQVMRRYMLALINDEQFLKIFGPKYIELALLAALMSSITRFPYSTIVHEIKGRDEKRFKGISREVILDILLDWKPDYHDRHSLFELVVEHFPSVSRKELVDVLSERQSSIQSPQGKLIHFLLNSSIDCRVLDYLRRDSLHLGVSGFQLFDVSELLRHTVLREGSLVMRSAGLSVVEQIVSLRYWLYNRIYWNMPHRAQIAMLRRVLTSMQEHDEGFERYILDQMLSESEEGALRLCEARARQCGCVAAQALCQMLMAPKPRRFVQEYQVNRAMGDAKSKLICDKFCTIPLTEFLKLEDELNRVVRKHSASPDVPEVCCLIDIPVEVGKPKLGDDLNMIAYDQRSAALNRFSGIVKGAQEGFSDHLQRLRVFVHPDVNPGRTDKAKVSAVGECIKDFIEGSV